MLRNYIKVALRHLLKNKTFSVINILGLSIGVACCIMLALYIEDELSFEKHFSGHERIYRITTTFTREAKAESFPRSSPPIAMDLADVLPEIEIATRLVSPPEVEQHLIKYNDKLFYEKKGVLVDSTFFEVFDSKFIEGDPATALDKPSSVVISEVLKKKIFNDKDPIDELLIINSGRSADTFRVSGVLKTPTQQSHTEADFYMGMNSKGWGRYIERERTWAWNNFVSGYLKLKPGTSAAAVEAKMAELLEQHAGADLKGAGLKKELHLQPLDDIRLYSDFSDSFGETGSGNIIYVYILGSIGIFILLIACINFMNLTTAKAAQRAGEVGIRKSMGAYRTNLIKQFLGESFTIVFTSLVIAIGLMAIVLPVINDVTQKHLSINSSNIIFVAIAVIVIGGVTGLLAGSYPAFFLSSFEPSKVLKSKNLTGDGSAWLRKGLVVFQFIIAITLISSIFIIQDQLRFIRNKSLGFRDEGTIMIPLRSREVTQKFVTLRDEFKRIPGVKEVSATSSLPSTPLFQDFALYAEGSTQDKGTLHRAVHVDEHYFDVLDIPLLAGRDFIAPTDTFSYTFPNNKILVNEESLKVFGIPLEKAVGSRLYTEWEGKLRTHEVIGVVKDFHQFSLHQPIVPMLFYLPARRIEYSFMAASLENGKAASAIEAMKTEWNKMIPGIPFESQYLSESIRRQYESDDRISLILTWSTVLAIIISCMGLYGLSIYMAERRIKEIGIRKVLGASVSGIIKMLSREFILLVMIAFLIAVPLAYYGMTKWLEGFAYKIQPGLIVFILAGVTSFLIAFLTIGFESIKAAIGNPVKALRSE
jgi:putative ABC transport system permease protein